MAPTVADALADRATQENFPVALRLLPARYRQHLMAVYGYARTVDDVGDKAPEADRTRLLAELEEDLSRLYAGLGPGTGAGPPVIPAVRELEPTIRAFGIPMTPFHDLIRANQQDQVVSRYPVYADLDGYCQLSANPVGRIVLYVFGGFTERRAELSDQVCTALQLAEHWQDVAEDYRAGRIYLPLEDLDGYGVAADDLGAAVTSPQVRALMAFEVSRARELMAAGAPLIGTLRGFARAAVAGYVAGGRAALAAIEAAEYDVLRVTPVPGRGRTAAELAQAYVKGR
jgi:squalene synthase HpnC